LPDIIPHVIGLIARVVEEIQEHRLETVLDMLHEGDAQLWCIVRDRKPLAIAITVIELGDIKKACTIWLCAGEDVEALTRMLHGHIEPWAVSLGCGCIKIVGRKGWRKLLPDFKTRYLILEKPLGGAKH
jgi:hypothetical protein